MIAVRSTCRRAVKQYGDRMVAQALRKLCFVAGSTYLLSSRSECSSHTMNSGQLAILHTIKIFPARTRCAALPWTTLESALDDGEQRSKTQTRTGSPSENSRDHERE